MGISKKFQRCLKKWGVSKKLLMVFREDLRELLERCFKEGFQGSLKKVSRVFQGRMNSVLN